MRSADLVPLTLVLLPLIMRHTYHWWHTRHAARGQDRRGWPSVVTWFLCYMVLMVALLYRVFDTRLDVYFWIGAFLLWGAAIGRIVSIRQLGIAFSEFIDVQERQLLVDTGIYAYVRHPLHYFLMLEMVAMAWLAQYPWGWGIVGVALVTLVFREFHEERALTAAYGQRYTEYCHRTVALVDVFRRK